jgi:RNA-directed DNA polymerase
MATRTGTTRTTSSALSPSADRSADTSHAGFSFRELVHAYYDCLRHKRNTFSALEFETNREPNLIELFDELYAGAWCPGRSICFAVSWPKVREVWAAPIRDRIVHHLVFNRIHARFENSFITDSCACIRGRGTLRAARRLEHHVRSITQNWSKPARYLKMDVANFFVSIHKPTLRDLLLNKIGEQFWADLTEQVLMHDPRTNYEIRGDRELLQRVPRHKRLLEQSADRGLPIGNLSSQFFANVYLDVLDQHVKHQLHARRYVRYVDDFVLLHESPDWLLEAERDIETFLPERLGIQINPRKTVRQPVARGVDFVGFVVMPWRTEPRRRTVRVAYRRVSSAPREHAWRVANSYFGLMRQASASHRDRAKLANVVRSVGYAVDAGFTKAYRGHK